MSNIKEGSYNYLFDLKGGRTILRAVHPASLQPCSRYLRYTVASSYRGYNHESFPIIKKSRFNRDFSFIIYNS